MELQKRNSFFRLKTINKRKGELLMNKMGLLMVILSLQKVVNETLEPSREKSLIMTKLDEAGLWLTRYIAVHAADEVPKSE
jgi:hypothetical protein